MDPNLGYIALLTVLSVSINHAAASTTTLPPGPLKCRICDRAPSLDGCLQIAACSDQEDCFMDEIITGELKIVYVGGCRAKDVCSGKTSLVGKRRSGDLIACQRCCSAEDDCNKRLCGIRPAISNALQCYSCDARHAAQEQVGRPEDCVSLSVCQSDEMCYTYQTVIGGQSEFVYGCQKKMICSLLMMQVFQDLDRCDAHPDPSLCGGLTHKRTADICHSCCGDGGCNYGSCLDMNRRLYTLYKSGKLDPHTLVSTG